MQEGFELQFERFLIPSLDLLDLDLGQFTWSHHPTTDHPLTCVIVDGDIGIPLKETQPPLAGH